MKKIRNQIYRFSIVLLLSCLQLAVLGQSDPNSSSSTTTKTSTTTTTETVWYTQPWVWVVGGAVFLIILVALLKGSSTSNTESRTTVIKDNT